MRTLITVSIAAASAAAAAAAAISVAVNHDGGPTVTLGTESSLFSVFVYTDPMLDHSDLIDCYRREHAGVPPWQDERGDMAQNMAEVWMHQALLEHPWRVFDPSEADLFFVPMYPVLRYVIISGTHHPGSERLRTRRE